ncbi:hypothetical protein LCGC14_1918910 [marine sediment metagenome]|uniref:Uncharacterized protein n=1 Tax=marine sediment metagenome TaxID=412755 RepID=A0A0F9IP54_9ZZZZ
MTSWIPRESARAARLEREAPAKRAALVRDTRDLLAHERRRYGCGTAVGEALKACLKHLEEKES